MSTFRRSLRPHQARSRFSIRPRPGRAKQSHLYGGRGLVRGLTDAAQRRARHRARQRFDPGLCRGYRSCAPKPNRESWSATHAAPQAAEIEYQENQGGPLSSRSPEYGASPQRLSCPTSPRSSVMESRSDVPSYLTTHSPGAPTFGEAQGLIRMLRNTIFSHGAIAAFRNAQSLTGQALTHSSVRNFLRRQRPVFQQNRPKARLKAPVPPAPLRCSSHRRSNAP